MDQQYIKFEDDIRAGWTVEVKVTSGKVLIDLGTPAGPYAFANISYDDARKLVEMLIKHTHPGQKLSLPMPVTAPQLLLAWQSMADGLRYAVDVDSEADATSQAVILKRSDPETPIRLALIIKEFVQPTPSYEWKDL